MGGSNDYAWVTSVAGEDQVDKACILARSLRRVKSALKLVAITGQSITKAERARLTDEFDLVVDLPMAVGVDGRTYNGSKNEEEGEVEKHLKVHGWSLGIFQKCAYLAPTMLVVKNCDDIFDRPFASTSDKKIGNDSVDDLNGIFGNGGGKVTCYVFRPRISLYNQLKSALESANGNSQGIIIPPPGIIDALDGCYDLAVAVGKDGRQLKYSGIMDGSIVNFVEAHPLDLWRNGVDMRELTSGVQSIEKVAVAHCWSLLAEQVVARPTLLAGGDNEPVAVVGLSFRLPGANTQAEFWNLLIEGREAVRPVPPHRWTRQHTRKAWTDVSQEVGFLSVPIDEFDAKFFGISPKEALILDPQQRLLLEVTWEALEDAGIDPLGLQGSSTGFFVGSWVHDYKEHSIFSVDSEFLRSYLATSIATESSRLSHFFGCTGPSISTESGCSSSIVAVDLAVRSLRRRETSLALASGVNILLNPFSYKLIRGVLSPTYRCRTFDASADGFARAEGVATLVLKRLSDALKDGDNIWGLIRGSGVAQEGTSKSLGTPTIGVEARAMELALRDAGLDGGAEVDYVEAHGTGTPVGDPIEIKAIAKAYHSEGGRTGRPLLIGSVKTNVGHTESVSGITGMIKVLLAMKHETIPPHRNLDRLNPEIDLDAVPAQIPTSPVPWPRARAAPNKGRKRIAGVSSFGISGTDGHVILEEPPEETPASAVQKESGAGALLERPLHILKLSAKTAESLDMMVSLYQELLEHSENKFEDICYSANGGRATFSQRAVIIAKDNSQALNILKNKTFPSADIIPGGGRSGGRICFLFTGQGSQYPGMASELYSTSPVFQLHFDRVTSILEDRYSISLKDVMWGTGDKGKLSNTLYSQTSIFCVEYALLKLWESWGVRPDYVLGHSLGEFAAAAAAGILEVEEALMLVAVRSRLIENLPRGSMLVVKADKEVVDGMVARYSSSHPGFWVDVAALNSPEQTVLAGDSGLIQEFAAFCSQAGLKNVVLASSHAFHSRHMDPILEAYERAASSIKPQKKKKEGEGEMTRPKFISGVEGRLIADASDYVDPDYWVRHTRERVNFLDACKTATNEGVSLFLEIGPHPVLSALAMRNMEGASPSVTCLPSLRRSSSDWTVLLDSLGKLFLSNWRSSSGSIDWKGFELGYSSRRRRVSLPFYPFNKKPIFLQVRPESPVLHPLLGRSVPTASSQSIYETEILLKHLPYLQDHVIGNTVIFPGAGYLEICLAAGFASAMGQTTQELSKPRRPIALKDLKILSPMGIKEGQGILLQAIADDDVTGGEGYRVKVCRRDDDENWVIHASSHFLPALPPSSSGGIDVSRKVDICSVRDHGQILDTRDFYHKLLPAVGLKFGPTFQTLETGWKSDGEDGILFKVKVPHDDDNDYDDIHSYLIHPVVADAMVQAAMLWEEEQQEKGKEKAVGRRRKLKVPLFIGEFCWLQSSSDNHKRYIHCGTSTGKAGVVCKLVDGNGLVLASMSSVEFVETSVKLVESLVHQQANALPKIWEEVYKEFPLSSLQGENMVKPTSWILFGGDDDELTQALEGKLVGLNKKVKVVTKPENLDYGGEQSFKESVRNEVEEVRDSGLPLEGVIYLWALSKDRDQLQTSLPFVSLCQVISSSSQVEKGGGGGSSLPKVVAVTQSVHLVDGGSVVEDPSGGTLTGIIRSIRNENSSGLLSLTQLDLSADTPPHTQVDQIVSTLWTPDTLPPVLVFRGGSTILRPKLISWKPQQTNDQYLPLPNGCGSRFQLALPASRSISDLEFTFLDPYSLAEDEVEIEVKAVALNFRDVLTVLKPIPAFENYHAVGLDMAGVVTRLGSSNITSRKVGDRVMCMNMSATETLASHRRLKAKFTAPLPPSMTFAEGSTLPVVFSTVVYCLLTKAGMRRGETVLVHTASGGVGLCAIRMARQVGAVVIATAGSQRKRQYLRNLGVEHVLDSRSLKFGKEVLELTGGSGVNIVLNSLTGPGFKEESLSALGSGGRFVEMSKLNVWTPEEVRERRPDVAYHLVDLTTLEEEELVQLHSQLESALERNLVEPIPHERFDALNIRGALNYLQKARHIGKIVCVMPELSGEQVNKGHVQEDQSGGGSHQKTPLFNEQSTYLVTGGLGGIGFEVVKWILRSGGKHVVIASRSPPKPEIAQRIQSWNKSSSSSSSSSGKHVEVFPVDVGNLEQCRNLFQQIQSNPDFPPVRGVMHAAGVLSDGILENQSWAKFSHTNNAKVSGSWNLHQLTTSLPLEHFVLFSSITATFGSPGQTNYSGSNSFQDALAAYRTSLGLPATSVNWGNWGEVGLATELDWPGMTPIRTGQGLGALELFLRTQTRRAVVANIDSFPMLSALFPNVREYVDDKGLLLGGGGNLSSSSTSSKLLNTDEFWAEVDGCQGEEERLVVFKNVVKSTIRTILRLEPSEAIEDEADFVSLGVDSLTMLELRNGLQNVFGPTRLTFAASDLKDGNTAAVLASRLLKLSEGSSWRSQEELPSFEELKALIREDSVLPEAIFPPGVAPLPPPRKAIDQVETILLTGVTGNLGPYLLRELSHRKHVTKIICLIRKRGKASPEERLKAALDKFRLADEVDLSKVKCVLGNISEPRFGLSTPEYKALREEVDAVVHSAVRGDHDAKYWKAPRSNKDNMRTVNILGTLHVIQFCIESGQNNNNKHLLYASTLLAVGDVNPSGGFSEDWQDVGAFDEMTFNWGYPLTKHVCEQLIRQAVERGLSCKTFRYPVIGGDSRDGRVDHQNSHFMLRWLAALKLKAMADSLLPLPYIPVDQCARQSLAVFFNPQSACDVYSMSPANPDREVVLLQVAKEEFGIDVQIVSSDQFLRVIEKEDDSSPLASFRRLYTEDQFARNVHQQMRWLRAYDANRESFFTCEKIKKYLPDFEKELAPTNVCLRRDLGWLREAGVFQKFGIKSK